MRRLITLSLLSLSLCTAGCVDNSGGLPPPGDKLEYERVSFLGIGCNRFVDRAWLIEDRDSLDTYLEGCGDLGPEEQNTLNGALADLEAPDVMLGLDYVTGGCLSEMAFMGAYKEDTTLHAWYLKGDSSFGKENVACPAIIGEDHEVVRILDAGDVASVDVTIGFYNPDLPGAPALPGG